MSTSFSQPGSTLKMVSSPVLSRPSNSMLGSRNVLDRSVTAVRLTLIRYGVNVVLGSVPGSTPVTVHSAMAGSSV